MFKQRSTVFTLVVTLSLLILSCAPAVAPAGSQPVAEATSAPEAAAPATDAGEKVVRVDTSSGKGTYFNPLYWIGTGSQYHTFMWIWPALTRADNNGQQIPNLAESFEASPDARTWTFHLPENATWSDGTPLTSADVVFSYQRKLDPKFMGALLLDWAPGWHVARLGAIKGYEAFANGEADTIEGIQAHYYNTVVFDI
jgi:ABC-type transport system substrate-binding protein